MLLQKKIPAARTASSTALVACTNTKHTVANVLELLLDLGLVLLNDGDAVGIAPRLLLLLNAAMATEATS
jgi:hypothetical protein